MFQQMIKILSQNVSIVNANNLKLFLKFMATTLPTVFIIKLYQAPTLAVGNSSIQTTKLEITTIKTSYYVMNATLILL